MIQLYLILLLMTFLAVITSYINAYHLDPVKFPVPIELVVILFKMSVISSLYVVIFSEYKIL